MKITAQSSPQELRIFYLGAALFCALIMTVMALAWRAEQVDEAASDAAQAWLARRNPGASVQLTAFEHRRGLKGKAVRVEYKVNNRPARNSPRYLMMRRPLIGHWEISRELDAAEYHRYSK